MPTPTRAAYRLVVSNLFISYHIMSYPHLLHTKSILFQAILITTYSVPITVLVQCYSVDLDFRLHYYFVHSIQSLCYPIMLYHPKPANCKLQTFM